jgi:hypothetical protein
VRSGLAVFDGLLVAVAAALLLAVPLTDRAAWLPWALVVVLALALGVAVLRLLAPASGWRTAAVFAALFVPMFGLAAVDAALGFTYALAHVVGLLAGRVSAEHQHRSPPARS